MPSRGACASSAAGLKRYVWRRCFKPPSGIFGAVKGGSRNGARHCGSKGCNSWCCQLIKLCVSAGLLFGLPALALPGSFNSALVTLMALLMPLSPGTGILQRTSRLQATASAWRRR